MDIKNMDPARKKHRLFRQVFLSVINVQPGKSLSLFFFGRTFSGKNQHVSTSLLGGNKIVARFGRFFSERLRTWLLTRCVSIAIFSNHVNLGRVTVNRMEGLQEIYKKKHSHRIIDQITYTRFFPGCQQIWLEYTPLKFNVEPEKKSLEKRVPLGNHHFEVPC